VIGATVGTFDELFALVARSTDAQAGRAISRTQRLRLAREAAARAELRIFAASARRPGFPGALEELVSELQAALVDPVALREQATVAGPYELEVASLYESYLEVRDELGCRTTIRSRRPPLQPFERGPSHGAHGPSSSTASTI